MISNARGKHSSPGVYMQEIDKTYATKSLGITTLGVVGETLKGPAFEPINISDWTEFQEYFGGTSTEKFKGNGYPKYELPYIAKSYLQESKQLEVCRVLGFSGYNAGPAWVIYGGAESKYFKIKDIESKLDNENNNYEGDKSMQDIFKYNNVFFVCNKENPMTITRCKSYKERKEAFANLDKIEDGEIVFIGPSGLTTDFTGAEVLVTGSHYIKRNKTLEQCKQGDYDIVETQSDIDLSTKKMICVIRSKATYNANENTYDPCKEDDTYDKLQFKTIKIELSKYVTYEQTLYGCESNSDTKEEEIEVGPSKYGKFNLKIWVDKLEQTEKPDYIIPVSLNPADKDYIINVIGMKADNGDYPIFVEEYYDLAHIAACNAGQYTKIELDVFKNNIPVLSKEEYEKLSKEDKEERIKQQLNFEMFNDYREPYTYASTPWFVSDIKGSGTNLELKKLFRFHTISDGNAANSLYKISVANILPDEGLFDILIRDFNDSDSSPVVLERYTKCNMVPGSANYIGLQIGTLNGDYANKSKYVTVEVIENDITANCVPCGFLGYPLRNISNYQPLDLYYNKDIIETLKYNRQYFGMSSITGVDVDVLTYKGKFAYTNDCLPKEGYTNGFHLDAYINKTNGNSFTVDGISGYVFDTPENNTGINTDLEPTKIPHITTEDGMKGTIYENKNLRKFTCYPYGGFDGWDVYRDERTNTKEFRANKYKGSLINTQNANDEGVEIRFQEVNKTLASDWDNADTYGLTGKINNSDYYAYLAGYKQFSNPSKIKINILATPGIDYLNNTELVNEVLDIVEESRQGDCIYIVTTPDKDKEGNFIEPDSAVSNLETSDINTSYAATYYPWVKYYDATNKKYINLPVTKDVVRNFAYTDNVSQSWFASAGMSRGGVDCVKANYYTKLEDEDVLYEGLINPVKSFSSDGVKIWGNKTMYSAETPLNRINVRRLMLRIKDLVMTASMQLVFEQNDNTVEAQFRSIVDPILANVKQNRGISDYKIETDTSAEARDRKELPAKIWVKPINCLEYIDISFIVTPEGASFED